MDLMVESVFLLMLNSWINLVPALVDCSKLTTNTTNEDLEQTKANDYLTTIQFKNVKTYPTSSYYSQSHWTQLYELASCHYHPTYVDMQSV